MAILYYTLKKAPKRLSCFSGGSDQGDEEECPNGRAALSQSSEKASWSLALRTKLCILGPRDNCLQGYKVG